MVWKGKKLDEVIRCGVAGEDFATGAAKVAFCHYATAGEKEQRRKALLAQRRKERGKEGPPLRAEAALTLERERPWSGACFADDRRAVRDTGSAHASRAVTHVSTSSPISLF